MIEFWDPAVRTSLVDFELHTNLAFFLSTDGATPAVSAWHVDSNLNGGTPTASYNELVQFTRPSDYIFQDPSEDELDQLDIVAQYIDLRPDRAEEIVSQLGIWIFYGHKFLMLHRITISAWMLTALLEDPFRALHFKLAMCQSMYLTRIVVWWKSLRKVI